MGTIRNRMVIVHGYSENAIQKLRNDAVVEFQKVIGYSYNVDAKMVSPIMPSYINTEYTFVINGECSKLGWPDSDVFQKVREEWCKQHAHDYGVSHLILFDFGEDFEPFITDYTTMEDSNDKT